MRGARLRGRPLGVPPPTCPAPRDSPNPSAVRPCPVATFGPPPNPSRKESRDPDSAGKGQGRNAGFTLPAAGWRARKGRRTREEVGRGLSEPGGRCRGMLRATGGPGEGLQRGRQEDTGVRGRWRRSCRRIA